MTIYADPFGIEEKSKGEVQGAGTQANSNGMSASIPELSGGASSAGASVGGKSAPTSSGLQQDFGKFRNANKSKITALGNLAVSGAQGQVNNAVGEVQAEADKLKGEVQSKARDLDPSKSFVSGLTKDSDINVEAINEDWDKAKATVDPLTGTLTSSAAATKLGDTVNGVVNNINTRAGTASAIREANQGKGVSSNAADQDSFLLRGNLPYQQQAQAFKSANSGIATSTLDAQRKALEKLAGEVQANNNTYVENSRGQLGKVQGDILSDLDARAADIRNSMFSKDLDPDAQAREFSKELARRAIADNGYTGPNGVDAATQGLPGYDAVADYIRYNAGKEAEYGVTQYQDKIAKTIQAERDRIRESANSGYALSLSPQRQAQLAALERLGLSGSTPQISNLAPETNSVQELLNSLYPGYMDSLRYKGKEAVAPKTALGPNETSAGQIYVPQAIDTQAAMDFAASGGIAGLTPEVLAGIKAEGKKEDAARIQAEKEKLAANPFYQAGGLTGNTTPIRIAPPPASGTGKKPVVKKAPKQEMQ